MTKTKILYFLLIIFILITILLIIYIFNYNYKIINLVDNSNNNNTDYKITDRIYFNGYEDSDCKTEKKKQVCEKYLGTISISKIAHATIKVQKISNERKKENFLYVNGYKAKIDDSYELVYVEPIKFNKENFEILLLFLNVKNEENISSSMLINLKGDVEKNLTSNYHNSYYETDILNDGNLYIFYNTCENNILQRHKLNLNYITGDTILYEEKVLICN